MICERLRNMCGRVADIVGACVFDSISCAAKLSALTLSAVALRTLAQVCRAPCAGTPCLVIFDLAQAILAYAQLEESD